MAYGYDGSLPTSVTWAGEVAGSLGLIYNNNFELESRTVTGSGGANAVAFAYDNDGLLTQSGDLTLTRDPATGFLSGTTVGGVSDSYGYDPSFGELSSYSATHNASPLYSATYTRDDLGRITEKVETIGGVTDTYVYGYDPAGRLETVTKDGASYATYGYDGNSNRDTWTDPWGVGSATYDNQDRLVTRTIGANGLTYSYTANGELASKTDGTFAWTYDTDVAGNLRQVVTDTGIVIDYVIDASNRRVGKKVGGVLSQGFLYKDQLNPVAELDGAGAIVSLFVYGSKANVPDYMVQGTTTYRVVSDHLGSVRLVVEATTGTVAQRLDYGPFGRVLLDTNPGFQPFGFAGGLYDSQTGLIRFGARDYDPEVGRWTAKDPIGFAGGDTNLYGYVLNNPIDYFDVAGLIRFKGGTALQRERADAQQVALRDSLTPEALAFFEESFGVNLKEALSPCKGPVGVLDARRPDTGFYDSFYERIHLDPRVLDQSVLFQAQLLHEFAHYASDKWFHNVKPSLSPELLDVLKQRFDELAPANPRAHKHFEGHPYAYAAEYFQWGDLPSLIR